MSTNAKVKPVIRAGNSSLMRPRFSPGLLLRDDDLNQAVDYTRDLSRLLFRSLFGCGVVCGLVVKSAFSCDKLIVTVGSGVALDCHGDPIHVPEPQPISLDPSCGVEIPPKMWVVIRRTEKCCAPRPAACSCDDEETPAVCTRERDGYEIRILPQLPECACGCTETKAPDDTDHTGQITPVDPASGTTKTSKRAKAANAAAVASAQDEPVKPLVETIDKCWCADPLSECYKDHYEGKCSCECCDCEWVVLACIEQVRTLGAASHIWVHHNVRRVIRPVIARDWQALHDSPR
jgi:hypothetical protein